VTTSSFDVTNIKVRVRRNHDGTADTPAVGDRVAFTARSPKAHKKCDPDRVHRRGHLKKVDFKKAKPTV